MKPSRSTYLQEIAVRQMEAVVHCTSRPRGKLLRMIQKALQICESHVCCLVLVDLSFSPWATGYHTLRALYGHNVHYSIHACQKPRCRRRPPTRWTRPSSDCRRGQPKGRFSACTRLSVQLGTVQIIAEMTHGEACYAP